MSDKFELNQLIQQAEKNLADSKRKREKKLKAALSMKEAPKAEVTIDKEREKFIQKEWEEFDHKNAQPNEKNRKREKVLGYLRIAATAVIILFVALLINFNARMEARKKSRNLILNQQPSLKRTVRKKGEKTKVPGVKQGLLFHEGKPSAQRPVNYRPPETKEEMEKRRVKRTPAWMKNAKSKVLIESDKTTSDWKTHRDSNYGKKGSSVKQDNSTNEEPTLQKNNGSVPSGTNKEEPSLLM